MNGAPDGTNGEAQICRSLISPAPTRRSPLAPAQPASARRRTAVPAAFRPVAGTPRRDQRAPGARRCARRRSAPERPRARAPQAAHSRDDHPARAGRSNSRSTEARSACMSASLAAAADGYPAPAAPRPFPPPLVAQAAVDEPEQRALFARTPPPLRAPGGDVDAGDARHVTNPHAAAARVGRTVRSLAGQRSRSHPPERLCCSRPSPSSSEGAGVSGDLPLTIAGAG